MKFRLVVFFLLLLLSVQAQKLTPGNIPDVVRNLSNEEKVDIVIGAGMFLDNLGPAVGQTENKVPGAAATSIPNSRIGLPALVFADGPAGVRISPKRDYLPGKTFYATGFPVATLLASSWDVSLIENVGKAFGNECHEYGVDFLLAPALNIHRNPLGGRNFEYYSEDPLLSGKMAASFVRGVQSQGVGTSIKHFVANNQETNRSKVDELISERALREIYLKGFEIAVKEGHPWTVMSSYNKVNGTYTSQSSDLLIDILRGEWKFDGLVMTDWFGGDNATEQMKAGNELLMPGTQKQRDVLLSGLKSGVISQEIINRNVEQILKVYVNTPSFKMYVNSNAPDLNRHKTVAREAASQGMVLLKNDDETLPLNQSMKVALLGNSAYKTIAGGTGSGDVNKAYTLSVYNGFVMSDYKVDTTLGKVYSDYVAESFAKIPPKKNFWDKDVRPDEMELSEADIAAVADRNDAGIFTLGRTSGEFQDRVEADDFNLTKEENLLISSLSDAFHKRGKRFVVVLNVGGVVETASWKAQPDAILLAWQPGQEAGNAIADVIYGKVTPSGKLPMTFPITYADSPSSKCFPGVVIDGTPPSPLDILEGRKAKVTYCEDIYVGYRYYQSFNVPTSYSFGYGLSYTKFRYDNLNIVKLQDNNFKVSFKITNTGKTYGAEVAQLYISTQTGTIGKPAKELKGFKKTKVLKPNESELISFVLTPYDLASYYTDKAAWITDKGTYTVLVAASVDDIRLNENLLFEKSIVASKVSNRLTPSVAVEILKK